MGQAQKKDSRPQIIRDLNVDHWGSITQALADDLTSDFWENKVRVFFFIRNNSWDFGKLYCGRWRKTRLGKPYWEPMTQQEMGAELGMQKSHVSRALAELRRHVFMDEQGRIGPRPIPLPDEGQLPDLVTFSDDVLYFQHANFVKAKYEAKKAELLAPLGAQKAEILASWKQEYEAEMEAVKLQFEKPAAETAPEAGQQDQQPQAAVTKNGNFSKLSPLDRKQGSYQIWQQKVAKSGNSLNKELRQERQAGETASVDRSSVLRTVPVNGAGKSRATENKPAPKPATAPAAPAARYPEQDLQLIRESIRQYVQPFELKNQNGAPLNPDEDHQLVAAVLNAGHLYGANSFQIAAYLYERFKYVLRNRRNAPQGAGWFLKTTFANRPRPHRNPGKRPGPYLCLRTASWSPRPRNGPRDW